MALTLTPSTDQQAVVNIPICFKATAIVTIPQEDERSINLATSGTNWTYSITGPAPGNNFYKKISGGGNINDADAIVTAGIVPLQPFSIIGTNWTFEVPSSPNRNYHCYVGIITDTGLRYVFEFLKYCNDASSGDCGSSNSGSNWIATVRTGATAPYFRTVNFRENFRVRSDGTTLHYEHQQGGIWIHDYAIPLPVADEYKFIVGSLWPNNEIHFIKTWKGSFIGAVPLTYSAPLGGTITGTGNNRCFFSNTPGLYQVCVDSEYDDPPLCVNVEVGELYFVPEGFDCGQCVFTDDIVTFQSNGGLFGTLTATAGTVIDSLHWRAPSFPTTVNFTYTIGDVSATCEITVVPRLEVLNVDGNVISGLLPGDEFQLVTNYDGDQGEVVWYNLDCPNVVTPTGLLKLPNALPTNCFGALDCTIRVVLVDIAGEACDNLTADIPSTPIITLAVPDSESEATVEWLEAGGCGSGYSYIDLRIIVEPVFPTPDLGGPQYIKWKPDSPDYRVIVNEFEGGCDETYLRNKVPVQRWQVSYSGLPYDQPCAPLQCCDISQGVPLGLTSEFQSAARLDEFWNLVFGQYGYFTLIEPRTNKVWQRVRFENNMERDHTNWRNIQSREFTLVWRPCCNDQPEGGTCPHNKTVNDNIFPGSPQNLQGTAVSDMWIQLTWDKAFDRVGIKGYEIEIDGVVVDVGSTLTYNHRPTVPGRSYTYRVRAYDFVGNRSLWSAPIMVNSNTDPIPVVESGEQVVESGEDVVET